MQAVVINLDRSKERLARMTRRLSRANVAFDRLSAFDGTLTDLRKVHAIETQLSSSELGCFLSHRAAWGKVVDEQLPALLIMEDDMLLDEGRAASVLDRLRSVTHDFDVIKLEAFTAPAHVSTSGISLHENYNIRDLWGTHYGAGAYVVTKRAAETLLQESQTINDVIDGFLFRWDGRVFRNLRIGQLYPALMVQEWVRAGARGASEYSTHAPGSRDTDIGADIGTQPYHVVERCLRRLKRSLLKRFGQVQRVPVTYDHIADTK